MERILFDNFNVNINDYRVDEYEDMEADELNEAVNEILCQELDDLNSTLENLFDKDCLFIGTIGRWNGVHKAGKIGDFAKLRDEFLKDCDYVKIIDKDGHLYITGYHHDGQNTAEVVKLTDKGLEIFDDWNNDFGPFANLSEEELHKKLYAEYSELPNAAAQI